MEVFSSTTSLLLKIQLLIINWFLPLISVLPFPESDSKYFADFQFIGATDSSVPCAILLDSKTRYSSQLHVHWTTTLNLGSTWNLLMGQVLSSCHPCQLCNLYSLMAKKRLFSGVLLIVFTVRGIWLRNGVTTKLTAGSMYLFPEADTSKTYNMLSTIKTLILLDLLGTPSPKIYNTHQITSWAWERLVDIENRLYAHKLISKSHRKKLDLSLSNNAYFIQGQERYSMGIDDDHRPFRDRYASL